MSRVLVAYASVMGSTAEIAAAIADELRRTDQTVECRSCDEAPAPDGFDAVVLGSAIYVGRWRPEATRYLRRHGPQLTTSSTFLFQSGPVGNTGGDVSRTLPPRTVARLTRKHGLRSPITFAGRLEKSHARSRLQRWMATGANAGDYRDWYRIRGWAHEIGLTLIESSMQTKAQP